MIRGVYSVIDQLSRTHLNTLERLIFHLVRYNYHFFKRMMLKVPEPVLTLSWCCQDRLAGGDQPHVSQRLGHRFCALHPALSRHHRSFAERPGHQQDHSVRRRLDRFLGSDLNGLQI